MGWKRNKHYDIENLRQEFLYLVQLGYSIKQFNEYHYRINNELDLWPETRKSFNVKTYHKESFADESTLDFVLRVLPLNES